MKNKEETHANDVPGSLFLVLNLLIFSRQLLSYGDPEWEQKKHVGSNISKNDPFNKQRPLK